MPLSTRRAIRFEIQGTLWKLGFKHVQDAHITLSERAAGAKDAITGAAKRFADSQWRPFVFNRNHFHTTRTRTFHKKHRKHRRVARSFDFGDVTPLSEAQVEMARGVAGVRFVDSGSASRTVIGRS